jgi:hypothetical protein
MWRYLRLIFSLEVLLILLFLFLGLLLSHLDFLLTLGLSRGILY